jgi:regulatory protein
MKIKLKNKSQSIYIIEIDGEIWGTLPGNVLRFFSLHPELENEFPAEKINELISEIEKFNWDKLLNFLTYRERSVWECRQFLKNNFLNHFLTEKLMEKAIDMKLVDDARFADLYVQDLLAKSRSRSEIRTSLVTKHLSEMLITEVLDKYITPEQMEEILHDNFLKAARRFGHLPCEKRREKILNYLIRKGFRYHEIIEEFKKNESR